MNDITRRLKSLPQDSLDAAINDPALRIFWSFFLIVVIICMVAR